MGDDAPDPVALIVDAQDAYRDAAAAGRPSPLGIGTQAVDAAVQGDKYSGSIVGRRFQFSHGIGTSFQIGQSIGAILACHNLFRVSAVFRCNQESGTGQSLIGVSGVNLSDCETVSFPDDTQFARSEEHTSELQSQR